MREIKTIAIAGAGTMGPSCENVSTSWIRASHLCDAKEPFGLLKDSFESGNFGVKSGKGVYDYSGDK